MILLLNLVMLCYDSYILMNFYPIKNRVKKVSRRNSYLGKIGKLVSRRFLNLVK